MKNDVNENEVAESKPKKKRRLRKALKISGISLGLLLFVALAAYLVCLFIVAGEIRENICAWRDDPDNPLNHRINAEPIEYRVDPEIAKTLEKFYIGKFEILLPKEHLKNSLLTHELRADDSDEPQMEVWPCYANYILAATRFPVSEEVPGYHEMQRCKLPFFISCFAPEDTSAVRAYDSKSWYLEAAYLMTTLYWDEPVPVRVAEMTRIGDCVPEDIEECSTPWAVCDLETRLLIKKMLIMDEGHMSRIQGVNWKACRIQRDNREVFYIDFDGRTYSLFLGDGPEDTKVAPFSEKIKQTILASMKIHDESNAGAIMHRKAREILDRADIKLQEKLLGRFYALCAVSQAPKNLEYAQTYLSTFSDPSQQAEDAYGNIAELFPDNAEIQKKATEIEDWYSENNAYFQYEGDDPEVEYPIVNEEAKRARVDYWDWKKLTDEEKEAKLQEAREREERMSKKRESRDKPSPSEE